MNSLNAVNELLIGHSCVVSIRLELNDLKYDLALTLAESEDSESERMEIHFYDVSALEIKDFGGGLTQLMHLKISPINSGLDRIRYEIRDLEGEKISFQFFKFSRAD